MKVYVDELPKCCVDCEWVTPSDKSVRKFCLLARMPFYNTEVERENGRGQHKGGLYDFDCPLQALAEHDKQVVIKVLNIIDNNFNVCDYVDEKFEVIKKCVLEEIEKGE